MKQSILLFSRNGFSVYLHWTFIALAVFVIIANAWPGNIDRLVWSVMMIILLAVSVLLHECGHAIAAVIAGIEPKEVVLLPIGGVTGIQRFPDNPFKEFAVSLAGPLVSLLVSFIAARILQLQFIFPDDLFQYGGGTGHFLLFIFYLLNLGIGLFNLIPAFPMDGGRILRSLLCFRLNFIRATERTYAIGRFVAIALLVTAVLMKNFLPAIAGLFIFLAHPAEQSYALIHSLVKDLTAGQIALKNFQVISADISIAEAQQIMISNDSRYFILERKGVNAGAVQRMAIFEAVAAKRGNKPVWSLPRTKMHYFDAGQPMEDLLESLANHPDEVYVVLEPRAQVKGVISYRILMEYLLLHSTHSRKYTLARSLAMAGT